MVPGELEVTIMPLPFSMADLVTPLEIVTTVAPGDGPLVPVPPAPCDGGVVLRVLPPGAWTWQIICPQSFFFLSAYLSFLFLRSLEAFFAFCPLITKCGLAPLP